MVWACTITAGFGGVTQLDLWRQSLQEAAELLGPHYRRLIRQLGRTTQFRTLQAALPRQEVVAISDEEVEISDEEVEGGAAAEEDGVWERLFFPSPSP